MLIKDLNGNHVIQKCLNKLAPEDNQVRVTLSKFGCVLRLALQFIYNAVAANCVEVATHRHGCCVLQRCIDHASDHQRIQLVNEITYNALTLVQDPYGNYVSDTSFKYAGQIDSFGSLGGAIHSRPQRQQIQRCRHPPVYWQCLRTICSEVQLQCYREGNCNDCLRSFIFTDDDKQCIRVAEHNTRKLLIEELLNRTRLEKLLRDSYGNYCVQVSEHRFFFNDLAIFI